MQDNELMTLYLAGDFSAFSIIYERYHKKIYGYLKNKGLSDEKAQDIFQQVFLKFHKNRHKYNGKYLLSAWLFTMTRHIFIDQIRKDKKWKDSVSLENVAEIETPQPIKSKKMSISLKNLNKQEKDLIQNRFFDEKTYEEISKQLGISQSNVRQRVSRTLKKLKKSFKG